MVKSSFSFCFHFRNREAAGIFSPERLYRKPPGIGEGRLAAMGLGDDRQRSDVRLTGVREESCVRNERRKRTIGASTKIGFLGVVLSGSEWF